MAGRLGNVLYWGLALAGAALLAIAAYVYSLPGPDMVTVAIFFAVLALIAWAIGWACRYVLGGH